MLYFNDMSPTVIYTDLHTLSQNEARPIYDGRFFRWWLRNGTFQAECRHHPLGLIGPVRVSVIFFALIEWQVPDVALQVPVDNQPCTNREDRKRTSLNSSH